MSTRALQFDVLLAGIIDPDTGSPVVGSVYFYEAGGTSSTKNVWTEKEKTNAYASYPLDSSGAAELYGEGIYRVIIKRTSDSTTVFDWDDFKIEHPNYSTKTVITNYTQTTSDDYIISDTSAGNQSITLLAPSLWTRPITIKQSGSNTTTVVGTIDGDTNYTTSDDAFTFSLVSDGTYIYKANHLALGLYGMTATIAEVNAACDGITATAAELNQLDDNTVGGSTGGDIVTIDGTQILTNKRLTSPLLNEGSAVTATATEVNILGGATISTAELNILGGITSSTAELNQLDGVSVGGSSSGDIVTIDGTQILTNKRLTAPLLNEGTALAATATELNQLDGVSVGGSSSGDIVTIDGTQSLSNKNMDAPIIDLGSIGNCPIGGAGTTAAAGDFTTLKAATNPTDEHGVGDRGYNDTRYFEASRFKVSHLTITGEAGAAITCQLYSDYNGDTIAQETGIAKSGGTNFELNASGNTVTIAESSLSALLTAVIATRFGSDDTDVGGSSIFHYDSEINFIVNSSSGTVDLTGLSAGETVTATITYISV